MPSSIVLIGPADAIPSLRERLSSGAELQTFTDAEAVQALEHIVKTRPTIVALEHEFSATSRGTALIDRVKADPELSSCEIRVIAHDGALSRVATRRSPSGRHIVVEEHELDPTGTRRVPRIQIREGVQVLIDGNPATLLSLSVLGAMVFSSKMLKPNQRVRVTLSDAKGTIRCDGSIIWASFEMPKGESPRYRAGLELMGVDSTTLAHFADRHRKS